jgi:hypothetical protein
VKFGDVLSGAVYGITGYVAGHRDIADAERVIIHNLAVLGAFEQVVVATNYREGCPDALRQSHRELWRRHLPSCVLLDNGHNRGHSIGTADLENLLFDYCRAAGRRWLCSGASDVLLGTEVLDIPVHPADFYYLNAVSYDALHQHDFQLSLFTDNFFFPQTTFYAINTGACDTLYDRGRLDDAWRQVSAIPDYNDRIWEYLPGWSCEGRLRDCVLRNRLRRCHLMSDEQWQRVLAVVVAQRISDCSFKGLSINGICHGQGLTDPAAAQVM